MAPTPGSRRRTSWIAVQTGVAVLLIAGAILLAFHPFGNDDHYTPPTTPGDRAPVKVGETAPDFTLPNAKGESVSLRDFRGKPIIFVFFRTFG